MAEAVKERAQTDPAYRWDLSSFFKDDAAWEEGLNELDELIAKAASFQGKLKDAETIKAYLEAEDALDRKSSLVYVYASSRRDEDTRAADAQAMFARAYGKIVAAGEAVSFSVPEILSLSDEKLQEIVNDESLAVYRHLLEDMIRQKEHRLTADQEKIIAAFGEALGAVGQAAENLMDADMVFEPAKDSEGNEHEVTGSTFVLLQNSKDRELRRNAFKSLYKGYKGHINTLAATYAGCIKASVAEAKLRGYGSSREMSMAVDNVPVSVYDNLIDTIHKRMDVMYRYVALRKRLLNLDAVHYYDVYAPLCEGDAKKYTVEEAKQMVLEAVLPLGEEYVETVKGAFRDGWVDFYPNKGKRGGAYSSGCYDSNPIILHNFTGTLDSVSTLAHEMGHSIHSWKTRHTQPSCYSNYTMFVAEVASTVNENLLIEQLLEKVHEPNARLALLNQYLEGFKGTVYRQTMFAEFEREAHAMAERGEPLDPESLSSMYEKLVKLYFGPDFEADEEIRYEWARIPHFYMLFYVYVYATGYSSAAAISEKILNEGEEAVKKYLEFLSMGSSEYPIAELAHAGVDLTTPAPIDLALDKFERILEDAEKTAAQLGK